MAALGRRTANSSSLRRRRARWGTTAVLVFYICAMYLIIEKAPARRRLREGEELIREFGRGSGRPSKPFFSSYKGRDKNWDEVPKIGQL